MDGSVLAIGTYLQGYFPQDLVTITKVAQSAYSMAKKAKTGMETLNLLVGQNTVVALIKHGGTLEGQINRLNDLVTEPSSLMLDIINGKIHIVGHTPGSATSTAGALTQADFKTYKAEQQRELALLKQEMGGGATPLGLFYSQPWTSRFHTVISTSLLQVMTVLWGSWV